MDVHILCLISFFLVQVSSREDQCPDLSDLRQEIEKMKSKIKNLETNCQAQQVTLRTYTEKMDAVETKMDSLLTKMVPEENDSTNVEKQVQITVENRDYHSNEKRMQGMLQSSQQQTILQEVKENGVKNTQEIQGLLRIVIELINANNNLSAKMKSAESKQKVIEEEVEKIMSKQLQTIGEIAHLSNQTQSNRLQIYSMSNSIRGNISEVQAYVNVLKSIYNATVMRIDKLESTMNNDTLTILKTGMQANTKNILLMKHLIDKTKETAELNMQTLQQTKNQSNSIKSQIFSKFLLQENKIQSLIANMSKLSKLNNHRSHQTVAFSAQFNAGKAYFNLNGDQVIIYDNVILNMGSAYRSRTGLFRSPKAGVYVFFATVYDYNGQHPLFRIGVNRHNSVSWIVAPNGSNMVVVQLQVGDTVAVYAQGYRGCFMKYNQNSFSGFLLHSN